MSYLNQAQDPRRRAAAIAGVTAIHAVIGLGLIVSLTVSGIAPPPDTWDPFQITPQPLPKPPPPEPRRQDAPDSFVVVPESTIDVVVDPPEVLTRDVVDDSPIVIDPGSSVDPVVPSDPPRALFTPRKPTPSNNPASWLSNEDYPARALRAEAEGIAAYRLIVGTNGRVSACEVIRSTGNAQLDAATCDNIARRARFEAATDETGAKVLGSYTGTVRWDIPD
jgi:protein TonB